jgi:hypothetical protein
MLFGRMIDVLCYSLLDLEPNNKNPYFRYFSMKIKLMVPPVTGNSLLFQLATY